MGTQLYYRQLASVTGFKGVPVSPDIIRYLALGTRRVYRQKEKPGRRINCAAILGRSVDAGIWSISLVIWLYNLKEIEILTLGQADLRYGRDPLSQHPSWCCGMYGRSETVYKGVLSYTTASSLRIG
ncbi:hypothetical protein EVAR_40280_1 [Eumeta japonica]|uniref:Uncharacterized protein n=1 Tax=Eumeta variegata TaxID=151549 RepID=A0A4C1WZF4_EUMVA|nr:hypothetical protein EVAR_40280_1 [Eumeta japonica]